MLIDTHCHLYMRPLADRVGEVLARARENGIERVIVPAINWETSTEALALAESHEEVYFAVGYHPSEVNGATSEDEIRGNLERFAGHKKLVAIGEIGLDFKHRRYPSVENTEERESAQKKAFAIQVEVAERLNLPIIIHNRDAGKEIINILAEHPNSFGVFHAYDGSRRTLRFLMKRSFFVSVAGNISYKGAGALRASLRHVPEEKLLLETDAPFMAPEPFRGQPSEPCHLSLILREVAEVLAKSEESIRILTGLNCHRLFNL